MKTVKNDLVEEMRTSTKSAINTLEKLYAELNEFIDQEGLTQLDNDLVALSALVEREPVLVSAVQLRCEIREKLAVLEKKLVELSPRELLPR